VHSVGVAGGGHAVDRRVVTASRLGVGSDVLQSRPSSVSGRRRRCASAPQRDGTGEGNRTCVTSLEDCARYAVRGLDLRLTASRRNATKLGDPAYFHGRWPIVFGTGIRSAFDSVRVMAGSFDHARVGAVPAVV
jgi:hypothetical protein